MLTTDKPAQANRLLGALSALTRFAHAAHGVGDDGLIQRVRALLGGTDDVAARDVVIPDELQAKWAKALADESAQVARYFKGLMLTGLRANELRKLPMAGWDSAARAINIGTTKNGKAHCSKNATLHGAYSAQVYSSRSFLRGFDALLTQLEDAKVISIERKVQPASGKAGAEYA